jgi:CRP-like cAMP-binding protein
MTSGVTEGVKREWVPNGAPPLHVDIEPVARRLRQLGLTHVEPQMLKKAAARRRYYEPNSILADDIMLGNPRLKVLSSGWACRQRLMPDGRRMIFSFLLPGDILGGELKCGPRLSSKVALTNVTTIDIPLPAGLSDVAAAIALAKSEADGLLQDQLMRLGRMSGTESMADLLLELHRRLLAVGLAGERWFPLPLRQDVLADALGFSAVHVNRTLQHLRREKLIEYSEGMVTLTNLNRLACLANGTLPETVRGWASHPVRPRVMVAPSAEPVAS